MVGSLVAVVGLFAAAVPGAGADQIGTTQAQIAALESQVSAGAARIHDLTVAYGQANLDATTLAQEVVADRSELAKVQARVSSTAADVRRQALLSYTGDTATVPEVLTSRSTDPSVKAEYLQVALGGLNDVVDRYRLEQRQLAGAELTLHAQEQAAQSALGRAGQARLQALQQAQAEQSQLGHFQAQLIQLQQAAATEAAAQRAAAQQVAYRLATQGLPVGNGLVVVVRSAVSASTTTSGTASGGGAGGVWLQLRECESGDNYQADTGNGFYGAYQFSAQTWTDLGYPGRADLEAPSMQDQAAMQLQAEAGWGQWPACAAALGLH